MQINLISIPLFGLLGYLLNQAGVGVEDKPTDFFLILATVVAIDLVSAYCARK